MKIYKSIIGMKAIIMDNTVIGAENGLDFFVDCKDYQREIYNGGYLEIYDSIIQWENGKLAHLRYVIDIAKE